MWTIFFVVVDFVSFSICFNCFAVPPYCGAVRTGSNRVFEFHWFDNCFTYTVYCCTHFVWLFCSVVIFISLFVRWTVTTHEPTENTCVLCVPTPSLNVHTINIVLRVNRDREVCERNETTKSNTIIHVHSDGDSDVDVSECCRSSLCVSVCARKQIMEIIRAHKKKKIWKAKR